MPDTAVIVPETGPQLWVAHLRHFMMDRNLGDNDLLMDLQFSDDEIGFAMERMVDHYNGLPPRCENLSVQSLPREFFVYAGVGYHLHLALMMKLMRNDVDYNAGGIAVEVTKRRIDHLKTLLPLLKEEFTELACLRKRTINVEDAYGSF